MAGDKWLAEIEIYTANDLQKIGAIEAYHRLKFRFGKEITLNALYAMHAALINCHWREITGEIKTQLRQQAEKQDRTTR